MSARGWRTLGLGAALGVLTVAEWLGVSDSGSRDEMLRTKVSPRAAAAGEAPFEPAVSAAPARDAGTRAPARPSIALLANANEGQGTSQPPRGARRSPRVSVAGGRDVPVRLDPPLLAPGDVTVTLAGHDPGGPRPLVLWRLRGERRAQLAEGHSTVSGRLLFPPLAAGVAREGLVVLPRGRLPGVLAEARAVPAPVLAAHGAADDASIDSPSAHHARTAERE